jgi:hypothetical protein
MENVVELKISFNTCFDFPSLDPVNGTDAPGDDAVVVVVDVDDEDELVVPAAHVPLVVED